MTYILIYILGLLITGIYFGYTQDISVSDYGREGTVVITLFWPFLLLATLAYCIVETPYWIGRKIRRW